MIQLVWPHVKYKASYLEYMKEVPPNSGMHKIFGDENIKKDFVRFVNALLDCQDPIKVLEIIPEWVPFSTFWLVQHEQYMGRISIRHELNEHLKNIGGHVGYDIRPTERRKGYGTLILKMGLEKARELGLRKILITCDESNLPSKKIIESNGGVFDSEYCEEGLKEPKLRYWVQI